MARLVFMGTPDFAVPTLAALAATGHDIAAVYSQPPRRAGRGQKPRPSPVARYAASIDVPVVTPTSLKSEDETARFAAWQADAAIVVAYGLILPKPILAAPRWGCINVHASLLPRWRGAAPIQRAIMAGDHETGLSIMQMDAGLDTGPVFLQHTLPITRDTTAGDLHDAMAEAGGDLVNQVLTGLRAGTMRATAQPVNGVTYADKIDKAECRIDWSASADQVRCQIHGLSPWPGAWTTFNGQRLKLLAVRETTTKTSAPAGTIFQDGDNTGVHCGADAVLVTRLQREGRQPMAVADFLRGMVLPAGGQLQ